MRRFSIVLAWLLALAMLAVGTDLVVASGPSKPHAKTPAPHAAKAGPACTPLKVVAPNTMAGLRVAAANPCSTFLGARGDRALNGVALLTLRESDDLLMATLEVGRFAPNAPLKDPAFQSGVVSSIGDLVPRALKVGNQTVYTSASPGLVLVTWIHGRYMFVLAIRSTYATPKELLRSALEVRG